MDAKTKKRLPILLEAVFYINKNYLIIIFLACLMPDDSS